MKRSLTALACSILAVLLAVCPALAAQSAAVRTVEDYEGNGGNPA